MQQHRLTRSAERHHGVLLPDALDRSGVSPKQRSARVQRGEWKRLPCGMLVVADVPATFEMHATAALAEVPGSVLSHESAARLHKIGLHHPSIHLCIPPGGRSRCAGVVLHRSSLGAVDVTSRSGFPTTTLERTLIDLGAHLPARRLAKVIRSSLIADRTTFHRVEETYRCVCRQGRSGSSAVRDALIVVDGQPPTESELEARFVDLLERGGVPVPQSQVTFSWAAGETGRVDFWYPGSRLIVELDGRRFHARLAAFERDRRRDQLALLHRQVTVRFTHHQLADTPDHVLHVLRTLTSEEQQHRVHLTP